MVVSFSVGAKNTLAESSQQEQRAFNATRAPNQTNFIDLCKVLTLK